MASTNGSELAAAPFNADIAVSFSLKLMNLLIIVFSMKLAKNAAPNYATPLFESAVAAIRPDLKFHCKHGDWSFVGTHGVQSEKILEPLCP